METEQLQEYESEFQYLSIKMKMLPNILRQGINDYSNTGTKVKHFEISNHLT